MKILWLQPYFPWPCTSGGKTRQYHILRELGRRGHQVTLVCLCKEEPDAASLDHVRAMVAELHWVRRRPVKSMKNLLCYLFTRTPLAAVINGYDRQLERLLRELLARDWDVVQLEHSYFYHSLSTVPADLAGPYLITEHNIESRMGRSVLGKLPTLFRFLIGIEQARMRRWEAAAIAGAGALLAVTRSDADYFETIANVPVQVVENGVDCDGLRQVAPDPDADAIGFLGNFDYYPNIDALNWLIRDILPSVKKARPTLRLKVFGHNCTAIRHLAAGDGSIEIPGYVDSLDQAFRAMSLFIAPLRHGGGSKLKILEAMAAGVPIVATSAALSGLETDNLILARIEDSADGLARAASELLGDRNLAGGLADDARAWVKKNHDWGVIVDKLESFYGGLHRHESYA